MYFYTAQLAHPGGESTRTQIAADSHDDARKLAWRYADSLDRPVTSVEVWR